MLLGSYDTQVLADLPCFFLLLSRVLLAEHLFSVGGSDILYRRCTTPLLMGCLKAFARLILCPFTGVLITLHAMI
jgi:hypothetical protein